MEKRENAAFGTDAGLFAPLPPDSKDAGEPETAARGLGTDAGLFGTDTGEKTEPS